MGPDMDEVSSSDGARSSLSLDAVLELLSHHQRRRLLRFLRRRPDQRASSEAVVACLTEQDHDRRDERPFSHVEITLQHLHEPKLSDADLLSYDEGADEYRYHPDEQVEKWLDIIESERETA